MSEPRFQSLDEYVRKRRFPKLPSLYRTMTELERARVEALAKASMFPGTASARFRSDLKYRLDNIAATITDKQAAFLERLCWRFRRQIPAALVPATKPDGAK